jgi:hypothetical protein
MAISRDQIAKGNQIGAGTVSEIIKQYKQKEYSGGNYSDFDLIRELAVMLKREGVDVKSFASSIRIQRKLDETSDSQKSPLGLNLLSIFKTRSG